MNEGDIVFAPLPQADGRIKNRPAVLLRRLPPFGDWLVCGVYVLGFHRESSNDT
jgi:mRNA interferase MazF